MVNVVKPYIFPETRFDPATVPGPWFEYLEGQSNEEREQAFRMALDMGQNWFMSAYDRMDDEDRKYCLNLFFLMGNPLWRHEAMNYLVIVKQFIN